jgi:hypothetical protein
MGWGARPLLVLILLVVSLASPSARAVGYHLLKVDVSGGVSQDDATDVPKDPGALRPEAGFGVSMVSDEMLFRMAFSSREPGASYQVREWWLESEPRGPVLGRVPDWLHGPGRSDGVGEGIVDPFRPFSTWRIGGARSADKVFDWAFSRQMLLNLPGFLGAHSRVLQLGPTLGLGLDLTWWDPWKGNPGTINTGRVSGQLGFVTGFSWRDAIYWQSWARFSRDLFGLHQSHLNLRGIVGFSMKKLRVPVGLELMADFEEGNDTSDTLFARSWSARGALVWRMSGSPTDREMERMVEGLRGMMEREEPNPENPLPRILKRDPSPPGAPVSPPAEPSEPQAPPPVTPKQGAETVPTAAPASSTPPDLPFAEETLEETGHDEETTGTSSESSKQGSHGGAGRKGPEP